MAMKRWLMTLAVLALALTGTAAGPAGAAPQGAAACQTDWGSLEKAGPDLTAGFLTDVRTGRHDCYDRIVFDVPGTDAENPSGYSVGYRDVLYDPEGKPIPVKGGALLRIELAAPTYDYVTGEVTYPATIGEPLPTVDVEGYRTFRDTRFVGSLGHTYIGLGVRAQLPFRTFYLPGRIVLDVAHSW